MLLHHLRNLNIHKSMGLSVIHPRILRELSDAVASHFPWYLKIHSNWVESMETGKKKNIAPILKKSRKEDSWNNQYVGFISVPGKIMGQKKKKLCWGTWRTRRRFATVSTASPGLAWPNQWPSMMEWLTTPVDKGMATGVFYLGFCKASQQFSL